MSKIDLRTCEPGDILLSSLGGILEYVKPLEEGNYFDHEVKYLSTEKFNFNSDRIEMGTGSRTHDGYVFKKNRKPETDHDIVRIIKRKDWIKLNKTIK